MILKIIYLVILVIILIGLILFMNEIRKAPIIEDDL